MEQTTNNDQDLVAWVTDKCETWRNHRNTNYLDNWQRYERLWRGIWASDDKQRESERSRVITPALQQAIEGHTAEITEAVFGSGEFFFDIRDDMLDKETEDVAYVKQYMHECFRKDKVNKAVADVILLGSIYGTGIGEINISEKKEFTPATQQMPENNTLAFGVEETTKFSVTLRPINPQNFLIDPAATTIEEALGCAIEEFVPAHKVAKAIEDGVYKKVSLSTDDNDPNLEATQESTNPRDGRVKIIRYYGLVPEYLLSSDDSSVVELFPCEQETEGDVLKDYSKLVEAIVIIGNDGALLKAEKSPYMMQDRPLIAYQDDSIPNRFWGRGIAEKGFNMQMAIDAQIRAHLDSLALTTVPMMAMDATRMPRGFKFEVRPGKTMLTNGNPNEILAPFKFGNLDQNNATTAKEFERMLLQATGTMDSAGLVGQSVQGEAGLSGMSMAMSGLIKKNKRTLVNFQEQFLIPFIEKAAYRFMQFMPEAFPVKDFKFVPVSTLGMLAREVEQIQLINLLKTLGPNSPATSALLMGIVDNSSLNNRSQIMQVLQGTMQPDPQQQQIQMEQAQLGMQQVQLEMQKAQADIAEIQSRVMLNQAKAQHTTTETQLMPTETQAKVMAAATNNLDQGNVEFERRVKLAELSLKEKNIDTNVEITKIQREAAAINQ